MTNPIFTMLVGLPGSGKSTYAERVHGDFVYLSTDALVEARAEDFGVTYNEVWPVYIGEATRLVNEAFRDAVKARKNILWDQTNLTVKKRRGVLSQLPECYYKNCKVFTCGEEIRQARLRNRTGKTVPPEVDKAMRDSFVHPTEDEGFTAVGFHVTMMIGDAA